MTDSKKSKGFSVLAVLKNQAGRNILNYCFGTWPCPKQSHCLIFSTTVLSYWKFRKAPSSTGNHIESTGPGCQGKNLSAALLVSKCRSGSDIYSAPPTLLGSCRCVLARLSFVFGYLLCVWNIWYWFDTHIDMSIAAHIAMIQGRMERKAS